MSLGVTLSSGLSNSATRKGGLMTLRNSFGVCKRKGKILSRLNITNKIWKQRILNNGIYLYNQRNHEKGLLINHLINYLSGLFPENLVLTRAPGC